MHQYQKLLLRAADRIRLNLERIRATAVVELPEGDWQYCQSLIRQLERAQRAGWINAATVLRDRYERALAGCAGRLHEVSRQVSASARVATLPTVREILCELSGLADEFETVKVDLPNETLSVTTETIVLEEITLGRFEIQLHWDRIGERHPYDVVALDPNRAGESSDTTHPHVKGERLCEGDGQLAIDRALRSGRLGDFFQIVNRILNTYNPGSAYVSLSDWEGQPCTGCGDLLREDDETACARCSDVLCRNCLICCERCDRLCCHSCTNYCGGCEAQICTSCEQNCGGCQRVCCSGCLCETGLCEACMEEEHAEGLDDDEISPDETAATALPTAEETAPVPSAASVAI
jgi:hypothetical protein